MQSGFKIASKMEHAVTYKPAFVVVQVSYLEKMECAAGVVILFSGKLRPKPKFSIYLWTISNPSVTPLFWKQHDFLETNYLGNAKNGIKFNKPGEVALR